MKEKMKKIKTRMNKAAKSQKRDKKRKVISKLFQNPLNIMKNLVSLSITVSNNLLNSPNHMIKSSLPPTKAHRKINITEINPKCNIISQQW